MIAPGFLNALQVIFWISVFVVFYAYIGYGLVLSLLVAIKRMFRKKRFENEVFSPPVSLIIAAYNEAPVLEKTISSLLALNYPKELLEIIFVTDGSTDESADILNRYPFIRHLHQPARQGKLAAINRATSYAQSEFLIFCDANCLLNSESITYIVHHYADPKVGGVAGEKKIQRTNDSAAGSGEGLYWQYESFLKKLDSELHTTVGAAGELFSIRRSLYELLPENTIIEDFVQSMKLCLKGFVVRYEPRACAMEFPSHSIKDEMKRKIRISAGAFQAMGQLKGLFNPFRFPLVWFQFISHRILRWTLCPLALVLLLLSNLLLVAFGSHPIYYTALGLQLIFYSFALIGWSFANRNKTKKIFNIPFYFLFMNMAVFIGFNRYLNKSQTAVWEKVGRISI